MRRFTFTRGMLASLFVVAMTAGACKDKSEASTAPDPAVMKAQQELRERRDALLAARQRLQQERDKVDDEMKKVAAGGGDTSELAKQRAEIDIKLDSSNTELITQLSSKIDALPVQTGGDKSAAVAARELAAANREKDFATREQRIADRERSIAERERALAERERTTCSAGTTTIIQAPTTTPKDGNLGKNDVVGMLNRAHAGMSRKGLLASDLGAAEGLEAEANKAVNESNWSKAYFAAQTLANTVDAIKIDRAFIGAKVNRLKARLGSSVSQAQADGMKEVLQLYGDGDFAGANRKLNAIWK